MPATTLLVQAPLERLRYLRELQKRAAKIKSGVARYYNDPAGFASDCIDWGSDGLTEYQQEIIGSLPTCKRISVRGPHGLGKGTIASVVLLWFALTRDAAGVDWKAPTTAGSWHQLTQYLWPEIHKWAGRIRWDKVRDGRPFSRANELQNLNLRLAHGAAFAGASANAALIEGAHADSLLFIFDEAKVIPAATFDACEGALGGQGEAFALSLSTPGSPSGRFYDIQTHKPGYEDWHPVHVTLERAIAAGRIDGEWAEQRARQWGEQSAIYQNRVLGEFCAEDEDSVIPLAWAEAAVARWHAWDDAGRPDTGAAFLPRTVGVDVARSGQDRTVLALRCGPVITELRRSVREDTMQTTGRVKGILDADPSCTAVVDVIGIGSGVVDRLREMGARVLAFNASRGTKLKDSTREFGMANCLTGDARVMPIGSLRRIYRSRYEGPLFRVETASGDDFTATANHKVLTPLGWVAVKELRAGDKLCDSLRRDTSAADRLAEPEIDDMPPALSQVYRAAHRLFGAERVQSHAVNFHGDRPASEVDVVTINRDLLAVNPSTRQHAQDLNLVRLLMGTARLERESAPPPALRTGRPEARVGSPFPGDRMPGRAFPALLQRDLVMEEVIRLPDRAELAAALRHGARHGAVVHAVGGAQRIQGLPREVPLDGGVLVKVDARQHSHRAFLVARHDVVFRENAAHDVTVNPEALAQRVHGFPGQVPRGELRAVKLLDRGEPESLKSPARDYAALGENGLNPGMPGMETLLKGVDRLPGQVPLNEVIRVERRENASSHEAPFVYTLETSTGIYRTFSVLHKNCRSAAWWTLRSALDPSGDPDICLPDDEMLLGDLSAPHWAVTSSGRIQVESKDEIRKRLGRSTDDGDAVVQAYVPHLADHVANARPWAGAVELGTFGQTEDAAMRRRRHVPGSPDALQAPEDAPWDLDGFGPQDDEQAREGGRRGNVRAWR